MNPLQIVFLFDLNAFNDDRARTNFNLNKKLLSLRLACLRILTHYSTAIPSLKWGFKFFDSCGKITQTMSKFSFQNVSLESFETLENEIIVQYQRHVSYLEALSVSNQQNITPLGNESAIDNQTNKQTTPSQLLQLALNETLCEFQWDNSIDMLSISSNTLKHKMKNKRNMLFLITKCATSDNEFQEYFGAEYASAKGVKMSKLLLSQSLQEKLLDKASILWIWINTSENQSFLNYSESDVLKTLSNALKSLQCALIPLCVLSQPTCILKFEKERDVEEPCQIFGDVYSSFVPFSTSFLQSISYPFYLNRLEESSNESTICFLQSKTEIPVVITKIPLEWNRKDNNSLHHMSMTQKLTEDLDTTKCEISKDSSNVFKWSKFTAHFTVAKHTQLRACEMFLCLPSSKNFSSYKKLQDLIKYLFSNNINLFIVCESLCDTARPGLFTPLSDSSAVISILNTNACYFLNERTFLFNTDKHSNILTAIEIKKKIEEDAQHMKIDASDKIELPSALNTSPHLKPFQMECIEAWFEPTSSVSSIFSGIQEHQSCAEKVDLFHAKLSRTFKNKGLEKEDTASPEPKEPVIQEEIDETCKDLTYDQLISMLTELYNSALESRGKILHSAKKLLKLASSFFLQKSIISYEESMKSFMAEFFCTTSRKLSEKYCTNLNSETEERQINECQMQVLLALEMEILFPCAESSSCVNMVTSFLRTMSFFSGATELNKFLFEVLKENYHHKLYDILVEIGDELDIPLFSEDDSPDEPFEAPLSASVADLLDSVVSSTLSIKSSSSTSSRGDNRRFPRKRSDISDMNISRQVLLPVKSPKVKKNKSFCSGADSKAIRCSPRLASKRRKEKFKTVNSKPESVRRNLFPRDKKPQTPRKRKAIGTSPCGKKRACTPKGHHVLKTQYVAETPAYKQKHSALQRRKSQIDISMSEVDVKEVAESPDITKNAKDVNNLKLLQKLREIQLAASLPSTSGNQSLPSTSSRAQYTPMSKRNLSLKLFSKLLTSPTARKGLKNCSKRLFDQVSPQKGNKSNKRFKSSQDTQDSPKTKKT